MERTLRAQLEAFPHAAARQTRLDGVAGVLASVAGLLAPPGSRRGDLLNGTWLGHPLHPVLTDVPIGFWTASSAFDAAAVAGVKGADRASEASIAIGLAGAVATAVSGAADWQHSVGDTRRVGVHHAVMNAGATLLYALSLLLRLSGRRAAGRTVALGAMGVATAGAYLGGYLVYRARMGIDHAPREGAPDAWTRVASLDELVDGQPRRARAGGLDLVLVRQGGEVFALAASCSHLGGPLDEGTVEGDAIVCPWHGSRFDLATGRACNGPTTFDQPALEARVSEGSVEVRAG